MVKRNCKILIVFSLLVASITLFWHRLNNPNLPVLKENNILDLFQNQKYYLDKNKDLYLSYYSTHPDLALDKIIAIINVKANNQPYSLNNKVDLTKGNLILVNKYNFLENYEPDNLVTLNQKFAYENRKVLPEVNEAFINMYQDALKNNINLLVISAYRSYDYQAKLYANYVTTYGSEYTDKVSAHPGYSEHQTGLALDILTPKVKMNEFVKTKAYEWLKDNSYKYGFILRYPEDKEELTGYIFEPWHYRYVTKEVATQIYQEDITFDEYYAYYLDN